MTTSMRIARWAVVASLPLVTVAALLGGEAAHAASVGPTAVAWFDDTEQAGAPAAPQPDVPAGGGLVAGTNPAGTPVSPVTSLAPTTATGPITTAVTAMRFTIADGTSASTLTLTLSGTSSNAGGLTLLACQTTSPWSAGDQQPGAGPSKDCTRSSMGTNDGTSVTFTDIGQLQVGDTLDFVLVPSAAGRIVIEPPTATALDTIGVGTSSTTPVFTAPYTPMTAAASTSPSAAPEPVRMVVPVHTVAPVTTGAAATPAPATATQPPQNPTTSVPLALPAATPAPLRGAAGAPPGAVVPTTVTGSYAGTPAQQPRAVAAVIQLKAHRTALLLALLLLLLLAVILFLLDPDSRTGRAGAALAALRGQPAAPPAAPHARGVGRHRSQRSGLAPKL